MRIWQAGKKREAAVIPPFTDSERMSRIAEGLVKHMAKLYIEYAKLPIENERRRKRLATQANREADKQWRRVCKAGRSKANRIYYEKAFNSMGWAGTGLIFRKGQPIRIGDEICIVAKDAYGERGTVEVIRV